MRKSVIKIFSVIMTFIMLICVMLINFEKTTIYAADSDVTVLANCVVENGEKKITGWKSNNKFETDAEIQNNEFVLQPTVKNSNGTYNITRKKGNLFIKIDSNSANHMTQYYGESVNIFIDVTYRDTGYGWFYLRYRTKTRDENGNYTTDNKYESHTTEYVNMTGTGKTMIHRFIISGEPYSKSDFASYGNACDFELCTTSAWNDATNVDEGTRSWSKYPVYISQIQLSYDKSSSPIKAEISSGKSGNVFADNEEVKFDIDFLNTYTTGGDRTGTAYEYAKKFNATYNVYKYDKNMSMTKITSSVSDTFILNGGERAKQSLLIPADENGLYLLEVILEGYNNRTGSKVYEKFDVEFSRCAKNTDLNPNVGVSTHFSRDGYSAEGLELMEKAGLGLCREDAYWRDFEATKGVYEFTDNNQAFFDNLSKTDIDCLLLIYANNALYDIGANPKSFPTATALPAFKNYVKALLNKSEIKDNIKMLEIWNEPDIMSYWGSEKISDSAEKKGQAYASVLSAAYDAAQEVNSTAGTNYKVGAFCVCKLWGDPGTTFTDYALKNLNGVKKFDNIVMHPYSGVADDFEIGTSGVIKFASYNDKSWAARESVAYRINKLKALITGGTVYNYATEQNERIAGEKTGKYYNFQADNSVWHSEFGYSSAVPGYSVEPDTQGMCTGSDYLQASLLIRGINLIRENRFDDKVWIYDLFNDGEQKSEEQHNYGLTNSLTHPTPMSAKFSYLAAANYNKLTADATAAESVYGSKDNFEFVTKYSYGSSSKKTYMLWTTKESAELTYNLGSNVKYYDILGNELKESDVKINGKYKLSQEPFYAVVNNNSEEYKFSTEITDGLIIVSGEVVSKIDFTNAKLTVYGESEELFDKDTEVMIGLYDGDRLVNLKKYKFADGGNGKTRDFDLSFVNDEKNSFDNIKAYIWKDMRPRSKNYDNKLYIQQLN